MYFTWSISFSRSATAVRSSANNAKVAVGVSSKSRLAGARSIDSIPSMASRSPCGVEPGEVTGHG
eukprot:3259702-Alexandrium_andersonii.AAC.1